MKKLNNANAHLMLRKILCITLILSMTLGMLQPAMAMEKLHNEISGAVSDNLLNMPLENLSPGGNGKAVAISAGEYFLYVLLDDGTVWYYEMNFFDGLITGQCHQMERLNNIVSIDAGLGTLFSLRDDGTVFDGDNEVGEIYDIVKISASRDGFIALNSDGHVWCKYISEGFYEKDLGGVEVVSVSVSAFGNNMAIVEHPYYGRSVIGWAYYGCDKDNSNYDEITDSYLGFTEELAYASELLSSNWYCNWVIDNQGRLWRTENWMGFILPEPFDLDNVVDIDSSCEDFCVLTFLKADGTVYMCCDFPGDTPYHLDSLENIVDVTTLMHNMGCFINSLGLSADGTIYIFKWDNKIVQTITDFTRTNSDRDTWYKVDVGNKTIYIKQPKDGDILAEARVSVNRSTNAKIYTYSGGVWSTNNQYASVPGGTAGTASVYDYEHGESANGMGTLNIIDDVIFSITEKVDEVKETIEDSFAFDSDYMDQEDWNMVTLGITNGIIDSVFHEFSVWNYRTYLINRGNMKDLIFLVSEIDETTARNNYYYINSKTGTEYCIMITAKIFETGSTTAAIVALTQAGISFSGGIAIFAGTGGMGTPIAISIEVESAAALVASGVCALAGVSAGTVYDYAKDAFDNDVVKCADVNSNIYSGELKKVDDPDSAADALAQRIGGESRVRFANDPKGREFDVISEQYIAEAKPALSSISQKIRIQMKLRFEAAKATGRKVYYHFEGQPAQEVIDKLHEYSLRYGVEVIIDTNPLFK